MLLLVAHGVSAALIHSMGAERCEASIATGPKDNANNQPKFRPVGP